MQHLPSTAKQALINAEDAFRAGDVPAAVSELFAHLESVDCAVRLREWAVIERRLELLPKIMKPLLDAAGSEAIVSAAVASQLRGDPAAALKILKPLLAREPELATAHHHAGRALLNLGQQAASVDALREALRFNPDYPEARYSLAHVLRAAGRMDEAISAYRLVVNDRPSLRMPLLNLGITLCAVDQPQAGLEMFDRLLSIDPELIEGWINRGLCLHILGRISEARDAYQRALRRDPQHPLAHFYLGSLLNEQMESDSAREHLEAALRGNPGDPDVLTELAGLMEQQSDLTTAERFVSQGLANAPSHPGLILEASRLARRAGRVDDARAHLLGLSADALPARMAQQYWFERTLMHDRGGEFAPAMQALERAHALAITSPRRRGIDPAAFPRRVDQLSRWLAAGAAGARAQDSDPPLALTFRPAFLVGFPRSGTTLLDTMLDAHPDVAAIEEKPTLESAVEVLSGDASNYPDGLVALTAWDIAAVRERYASVVRSFLFREHRGIVLDKLPMRLLRVPQIHRLFPDAPIVFALRHPCDVVLSNVMQQYRPNEAFIHFDTLHDAARTYDRVMRVWLQIVETLPITVHYVRYEALIVNPAAQLASACEALGISLTDDMLDPAKRMAGRARIQTNSYQQVAEPVYQRAAGRWQNYRQWINPILPILRPHIERFDYAVD